MAIPAISAVQRDQHRRCPREILEHAAGAALLEDRVAQRAGQPIEHGRAHQEGDLLRRQVRQHRIGDVVGHEAVVAAEGCDRSGRVRLLAQRQRCEVQPRRPAFGAPHEGIDVTGPELHAGAGEQRGGLGAGHDEVPRPELDERSMAAKASERQARLAARRQGQLASFGRVLGHRGQRADRRARAQELRVVDDEDELSAAAQGGTGRARQRGAQPVGIVVGAIQRDPREPSLVVPRPFDSVVVLPYPAGATSTTSRASRAAISRRTRRARDTSPQSARLEGAVSSSLSGAERGPAAAWVESWERARLPSRHRVNGDDAQGRRLPAYGARRTPRSGGGGLGATGVAQAAGITARR